MDDVRLSGQPLTEPQTETRFQNRRCPGINRDSNLTGNSGLLQRREVHLGESATPSKKGRARCHPIIVNSRANGASDSRPNRASAKWRLAVSNG
jgi:hypothetical protein